MRKYENRERFGQERVPEHVGNSSNPGKSTQTENTHGTSGQEEPALLLTGEEEWEDIADYFEADANFPSDRIELASAAKPPDPERPPIPSPPPPVGKEPGGWLERRFGSLDLPKAKKRLGIISQDHPKERLMNMLRKCPSSKRVVLYNMLRYANKGVTEEALQGGYCKLRGDAGAVYRLASTHGAKRRGTTHKLTRDALQLDIPGAGAVYIGLSKEGNQDEGDTHFQFENHATVTNDGSEGKDEVLGHFNDARKGGQRGLYGMTSEFSDKGPSLIIRWGVAPRD